MIRFYIGLAISAALLILIIILMLGKCYRYTVLYKDTIFVINVRKNYRGIKYKPAIEFIPANKLSAYQAEIEYSKTLPDYDYVMTTVYMFTDIMHNSGINITEK